MSDARSTGLGYCHGYRQPDEHYHDSYEDLVQCESVVGYWWGGAVYTLGEYIALRPHSAFGPGKRKMALGASPKAAKPQKVQM